MHEYFAKRVAYVGASALLKLQDNSTATVEEVGRGQSKLNLSFFFFFFVCTIFWQQTEGLLWHGVVFGTKLRDFTKRWYSFITGRWLKIFFSFLAGVCDMACFCLIGKKIPLLSLPNRKYFSKTGRCASFVYPYTHKLVCRNLKWDTKKKVLKKAITLN